jgi:prepilin-type N-terminal cleavage/methylation domain-containing protein
MDGSHKKAFTLIELLVVMAVISLLIAVMVPALQSVRHQARRIHCGTNLKNIGVGLIAFANQNDDSLPQPQYSIGTSPIRAYSCYEASNPQTPLQLAVLHNGGYIGDNAKILYCPSSPSDYDSYTANGSWGTCFVDNSIRAAYLYAPFGKEKDAIGLPMISSRPRLSELEQTSPIVTDKIDTWDNIAHQSSKMVRGINTLFVDGGVKFCNEAGVMDYNLWHPFGANSPQGPGSSDLAVRAILSSIRE